MHLIYLLTNIDKPEGKRFYIGSKQECYLRMVDGIPTIISTNSGKPYYSSSSSIEMREEMKRGERFSASILEEVQDRKKLIEREDYWISHFNAVKSQEYYNMSNAKLNCHDQDAVANKYGETVKELAGRNSSWGKRDATAKQCGFNNFGLFCIHLYERIQSGERICDISYSFNKHRHFARGIIQIYDMEKVLVDSKRTDLTAAVRDYIKEGCSLYYAAELLKIEIPAARILLGDYNAVYLRSFSVARDMGKTKEELEIEITQDILAGKGFTEISRERGIIYESVKRYFLRCVRRNLKDIELV